MTDNTTLNTGTAGDVIRDLDRSGIKTQVVALDQGGTGGEDVVTAASPLRALVSDFAVAIRHTFLNALNHFIAIENNGGRVRVVLDAGPGAQTLGTVTTVTTVSTVTAVTNVSNLVAIGPASAGIPIRDAQITPQERAGWALTVRSCIA